MKVFTSGPTITIYQEDSSRSFSGGGKFYYEMVQTDGHIEIYQRRVIRTVLVNERKERTLGAPFLIHLFAPKSWKEVEIDYES